MLPVKLNKNHLMDCWCYKNRRKTNWKKKRWPSWDRKKTWYETMTFFFLKITKLIWTSTMSKLHWLCYGSYCGWKAWITTNPHSSIREQVLILTYVPWSLNNYTEKDKLRPSLPGHMPFVQINSWAGNYSEKLGAFCKEDNLIGCSFGCELKCFHYADCVCL